MRNHSADSQHRVAKHKARLPLIVLACLGLSAFVFVPCSCGDKNGDSISSHEKDWASLIDEDRAFADLVAYTEIGPKSHEKAHRAGLDAARTFIKERLKGIGVMEGSRDRSHRFRPYIPKKTGKGSRAVTMENIVGSIEGRRPEAIAIACHYDSKAYIEGFLGANDGASGVALTIELARNLAQKYKNEQPEFTYYFVFFDGEEAIKDWRGHNGKGDPDNCYGSRHMAANLDKYPVTALILLDMVGDKDLELIYESSSSHVLNKLFSKTSQDYFGIDLFGKTQQMADDHIPFAQAGVKLVIDLIDFNYGPGNTWWHTKEDTVDKCSARSLAKVGSLVLQALPEVEKLAADTLK